MIRLPKEFGRKLFKGLNVVEYWETFMGLREHAQGALYFILGGALAATVLRIVGVWHNLDDVVVGFLPALAGMVNTKLIFLSLLSYIYLPLVGQQIFMARSKNSKHNDSYITYFGRYLKAMLVVVGLPSIAHVVASSVPLLLILHASGRLLTGPQTALTIALWCGLGLIWLVVIGFVCAGFAVLLGLGTYSFAFVLQGVGLRDSVVRGVRLFFAQWVYTVTLILVFLFGPNVFFQVMPSILGAAYFPILKTAFVQELFFYMGMFTTLVYYVVFFAYHKRVSKVPSSR